MYQTALEFFREAGWPIAEVNPGEVLQTVFTGRSGQYNCYLQVPPNRSHALFYSLYPTHAEAPFDTICEYLTLANFGLIIGNFELDLDDGGIRFKTAVDGTDREVTSIDIRNMVEANLYTLDRYAPGIAAVLAGTQSPREAIEQIERQAAEDG